MMADSFINFGIHMTIMDVEKTLRNSIKKLFRDRGVDKEVRLARAKGLLMMGQVYMEYGETDMDQGMQIMKRQLQGHMSREGQEFESDEDDLFTYDDK